MSQMEEIKIKIVAQVINVHLEKVENDSKCNACLKTLHKSFEVLCGHKFCLRCILYWK
jgi:hypothetical protein